MKAFAIRSALLVLALVVLAGCKREIQTSVDTTGPTVQEALTYDGPKARIMVSSFKCKAAKCEGAIGDGLSDMLTTALFKSNRFVVIASGEVLDEALREQALAQTGVMREGGGPETGMMEGADIIITGSISGFEPDASGGGLSIFGAGGNIPFLGGLGGASKEAFISADIRLVDIRTRRIVNATTVEGRASSWSMKSLAAGRVGGIPLGGSLGMYENTPMEDAVRVMLDNAVQAIGQLMPQEYYRVTE